MSGQAFNRSGRRFPWQGCLVLLGFAVLVCLRIPDILLKGRFWAEEGRYFLVDAWTMPPLQALLAPVGGYLNLVANAALLSARWLMPLAYAPYLTITVALLVQMLPPLLLLSARDPWLQPWPVRIAGVALLLLVPNAEEIWLQTLHCRFELTLASAIILCLRTVSGAGAAGRLLILLLAPLCGPGAIALVPLFGLRLLSDRSGHRLLQCIALSAGGLVQLLGFMSVANGRAYAFDPAVLSCILFVRHLAAPFLGSDRARTMAEAIRWRLGSGHVPHVATLVPVLVFGGAGILSLLTRPPRPAFWLLLAGLFVAALSYYGAIGRPVDLIDVRFGERYAFVPEALFGLALLALARTLPLRAALLFWLLLGWQLVGEAMSYPQVWPFVADGPAWRPEVAAWRADPAHLLRTWPDGWAIRLSPDHRPLPQPR